MTTVLLVTTGLLVASGALLLLRLLRGPTVYDRLVALDTLVVVLVSAIALRAALLGGSADVVLLVVVALVGFLTSLAAVRLLPEERE